MTIKEFIKWVKDEKIPFDTQIYSETDPGREIRAVEAEFCLAVDTDGKVGGLVR